MRRKMARLWRRPTGQGAISRRTTGEAIACRISGFSRKVDLCTCGGSFSGKSHAVPDDRRALVDGTSIGKKRGLG